MSNSQRYQLAVLVVISLLCLSSRATAQNWHITGNSGTVAALNFLGTTDNEPLAFRANNSEAMRIISNGNVGIGTRTPQSRLTVAGTIRLLGNTSGQLVLGRFNANSPNAFITARADTLRGNAGIIFRTTARTGEFDSMIITGGGRVGMGTMTPTQTLDVLGSGITFRHINGNEKAFLDTADGFQAGAVAALGPTGKMNAVLINVDQNANHGAVAVFDAAETAKAFMLVDVDGRGFVVADVKSFRVPNAKKPGTDIVYASVEGPEAAAYVRGTARLVDGMAAITFPDHFMAVASSKGMTVQLTPLSADSLGLAVVEKDVKGLRVRELHGGKGSYEFDWEVKCIRKGYEDYQVIQQSARLLLGRVDKRGDKP